jgi:hypothetical protein
MLHTDIISGSAQYLRIQRARVQIMQSQEDSAYVEGIPGIQPSCEALRAVTTRQVIMHYPRLPF